MKGFCKDDERRIKRTEIAGDIDIENIIGAKVYVKSVSGQNGWRWTEREKSLFTISGISFRVSIDGKCFTLVELEEFKDRMFTLKDLEFVELYEQDS